MCLGGCGDFTGAIFCRRIDIQREQGGGRELIAYFMAFQIVVGIPAFFVVPQVLFDPFLSGISEAIVLRRFGIITGSLAGEGDHFFHFVHQRIEIDRNDAGGAQSTQLIRIVHPAGAKIPAGRSR